MRLSHTFESLTPFPYGHRGTVVEGDALAQNRFFGVTMELQRLVAFLKAQTQAGCPVNGIFIRDSEELVVKAQNFIILKESSMLPEAEWTNKALVWRRACHNQVKTLNVQYLPVKSMLA